MQQAFNKMRLLMAANALAAYPDHNKWLNVYTDASDFQLGACIIQEGRPVAYISQKLMKSQKNHTTNHKKSNLHPAAMTPQGVLRPCPRLRLRRLPRIHCTWEGQNCHPATGMAVVNCLTAVVKDKVWCRPRRLPPHPPPSRVCRCQKRHLVTSFAVYRKE